MIFGSVCLFVRSITQQEGWLPPRQLKFGTFNVCSLRNKVDGVQDILTDYDVDILCLTET